MTLVWGMRGEVGDMGETVKDVWASLKGPPGSTLSPSLPPPCPPSSSPPPKQGDEAETWSFPPSSSPPPKQGDEVETWSFPPSSSPPPKQGDEAETWSFLELLFEVDGRRSMLKKLGFADMIEAAEAKAKVNVRKCAVGGEASLHHSQGQQCTLQ